MRNIKRVFAGFLAIIMVLLCVPFQTVSASENTSEDVRVQSVVCEKVEIVEGTNGYYNTYGPPGQQQEYYVYGFFSPVFHVTFTDGTTFNNQRSGFSYNGEYYSLSISHNQSYENQWGLGIHTATATLGGVQTSFEVHIVESPIANVRFEPIEIIEGTNGSYTTEYDSQSGTYKQYFKYSSFNNLRFTVEFKDGTVLKNQTYLNYNGDFYYPSFPTTDQSYSNQWGIGEHTATIMFMGIEATIPVHIVESPIESIVFEKIEIVKNTNGYYATHGENIKYFVYYVDSPKFTVKFKDGVELKNQSHSVNYKGQSYYISTSSDQSYDKRWEIGTHMATATIMGFTTTFPVEIVESPIVNIEIEDVTLLKGTNGSYKKEYNSNTGKDESFYNYECMFNAMKVYYQDGSVEVLSEVDYTGSQSTNQHGFFAYGKSYSCTYSTNQSAENPWDVGEHIVNVTVNGFETTYKVHIVEQPYVSLEILNMDDVVENEHCSLVGEKVIYDIPAFSYRVTKSDGTSFVGYYGVEHEDSSGYVYYEKDPLLNVSSDQYTQPWTVGGDNYFTVIYADLEIVVKAEVKESTPYEYYIEDGAVFVTGYKEYVETLSVPSMIEGLPVVALLGLGNSESTVKELIIPDSVKVIAKSVLGDSGDWRTQSILEKITIGSSIAHLEPDMFACCPDLAEIHVSENNPYYSSIDGVVYDKTGTTLVVYPLGRGDEYTVPANVIDIDVMFLKYGHVKLFFEEGSEAFVKEDGVLYAAGKTKIISCDVDKIGEYVMPDSVTELTVGAFKDCTKLTSVVVSKNVTSITYCAFYNCTSLTSVTLPSKLTTIDRLGFGTCVSLKGIELPESLNNIGESAFSSSGLLSIDIPNHVAEIGAGAFLYSDLTDVQFGKELKSIGAYAFDGTQLEKVTIGDNVETIGAYAFGQTPLMTVNIGGNVKKIDHYAFYQTKIEEITLPNSLEYMGYCVFAGTPIKELTIPDMVTQIGLFGNCWYLEKIVLGNKVSNVPNYAFAECPSLKKVNFKNSSVYVGNYAFYNCPLEEVNKEHVSGMGLGAFDAVGMTKVTIPKNVTEVTYQSFSDCDTWAEIDVPESLVHIGRNSFDNTQWYENQDEGVVYLEHILYEYKGDMPKDTTLNVKSGTTVIADNAFEKQKNLKKISLPNGLLTIGQESFKDCSGLSEIHIPASVNCIDKNAFLNSGLTAIHVDAGNKYYSSEDGVLFSKDGTELLWCPKQTEQSYTVPRTVKYIAENAFCNSGITELTVQNYYTEFKDKAYGYELASDGINSQQYMEVKLICFENSLADVYAKKNCITSEYLPYGWIQDEYGWKYINDNGQTVRDGWKLLDDNWYYFKNEYRVSGWLLDGGKYYYMNPETGIMTKNQWVDNTYYIDPNGVMVTGWKLIDGHYYYFHGSGAKATNQWIGSYFLKSDGVMATNEWIGNYYVNASGVYISVTGWFGLNNEYYYLNAGVKQYGWILDSGKWYYMNTNTGAMLSNEWLDDSYYFLADGAMATGWLQMSNGDYHYFNPMGNKVTNQWVGSYYIGSNGVMLINTWVGSYYVDASGAYVAKTGWFYVNGEYYYLIGGAKQTGWLKEGSTWYYLDAKTGIMYADEWLNKMYYFYGNGAMATGWVQMKNGDYYYFKGSGEKVTNQWVGDYYLGEDGVMLTSQWVGKYWVDETGKWDPQK